MRKYLECSVDDPHKSAASDLPVARVEGIVNRYCLMLPFAYEKKLFEKDYDIVYDDWEVGNEFGEIGLPYICDVLFRRDVLGV